MERMKGGPDSVLWERWEWSRADAGDCPEGTLAWNKPVYCFLTNRCDSSVTMKGDGVKVWRQPALYAKCSQVSTPNN